MPLPGPMMISVGLNSLRADSLEYNSYAVYGENYNGHNDAHKIVMAFRLLTDFRLREDIKRGR